MVLVAMQLVVRVPGVALVLSRVAVDVLALVPVAHLELIRGSYAVPASVGRSGEDAETNKVSGSHFTGSEVGVGGTGKKRVQVQACFPPWIVTVACAEPHSSAAGARALSKLTPRAPVSILLHDVGGQPDAVTFEAVLHWAEWTRQVEVVVFFFLTCFIWTLREKTES